MTPDFFVSAIIADLYLVCKAFPAFATPLFQIMLQNCHIPSF